MSFFIAIITVALIGFGVHLIVTYIPMPEFFKNLVYIIAGVALLLYLFRALNITLPHLP